MRWYRVSLVIFLIGLYYSIAIRWIQNRTLPYNFSNKDLQARFQKLVDVEHLFAIWRSEDHKKREFSKLSTNSYGVSKMPVRNREQIGKENATLLMLVRNSELEGALDSMRSLEDRFNRNYKYPWVFLNDEPFDIDFIEQTTLMASGKTYYELVSSEDWNPPPFIDKDKLEKNLVDAAREGILYGGSKSYRNMCHFNSGYFFKQKRLLDFDWYFRVEPNVQYLCDFLYDPFTILRTKNKVYGFVLALQEYENTIPSLWETVKGFMETHKDLIHPNNSLDFITTNETDINHGYEIVPSSSEYNLCHFWSNFEIGNLNFFRSDAYQAYFDYLDKSGGFYYERWGDAPVHSIGLSILADKNSIHHFEDIGYYHAPFMTCPSSIELIAAKRCICKTLGTDDKVLRKSYDVEVYSCLSRWWRYGAGKTFLTDVEYTMD